MIGWRRKLKAFSFMNKGLERRTESIEKDLNEFRTNTVTAASGVD
jgi:hypothetical protein